MSYRYAINLDELITEPVINLINFLNCLTALVVIHKPSSYQLKLKRLAINIVEPLKLMLYIFVLYIPPCGLGAGAASGTGTWEGPAAGTGAGAASASSTSDSLLGWSMLLRKKTCFFFCLDDIYLYCTLKIDRIVPHCKSFLWP